jgi:hypothetical protein
MKDFFQREIIGSGKRILLVAMAAGISAMAAAFGNLLEDGSFDSYPNGNFDFWMIGPKPDSEGVTRIGVISQDSDGGFPKGGNALKLTYSGSGTYTVIAKGPLTLAPGRKYRLTVHAKSTVEPVRVRVEVRPSAIGQSERTRVISFKFNTDSEWQDETVEWQAAENETGVDLVFYLENRSPVATTIWLDEIAIDPIDG